MMEGLLSLRGVYLSFPRGRRHTVRVLNDVSLDVHAGEVVAVLAQRAQGKTSLLRVAAGMERPDRGQAMFAGQDMWPRKRARPWLVRRRGQVEPWRERIVLVRQNKPDVDVPVLEGVALPLSGRHGTREAGVRALRALRDVGAEECAQRAWEDLGDAERARVALAQAIAREPRLLLIDDLAETLDLVRAQELAELVHTLACERELGALVCVGDARATSWSERVATLAGGELLTAPMPSGPVGQDHANVIDFPSGG